MSAGRLCMVVHSTYPVGEPRVQRQARVAREEGFEVDVICLRQPGESRREEVDGVRVLRLPIRHRRGVGLVATLLEYVAFAALATIAVALLDTRRYYDVVHVHAPPDFLAVTGVPARLRGRRVLLDVHDISALMFAARFEQSRLGALVQALLVRVERLSAKIAHGVVTVHEPYRRELETHGVPSAKITVVMNSPDAELIERARRAAGAAGPEGSDGWHVVYHGTVTGWYGVPLVVEAVSRLRPRNRLRVSILGEGDDLPQVHALADELGVADDIVFSDRYLPIDDALRQVAVADCGVVPNLRSALNELTLSSKLLEYVALEVPVVVARLRTLAAHFSDAEVTFFEPGDPTELADALRWVADNPEEAREKARRARQRAAAYGWEENRGRYAALLHEMVAP